VTVTDIMQTVDQQVLNAGLIRLTGFLECSSSFSALIVSETARDFLFAFAAWLAWCVQGADTVYVGSALRSVVSKPVHSTQTIATTVCDLRQ